jgi:hypothetical protein
VPATCQAAGAAGTRFPATGHWSVVDQQAFAVGSLPAQWYAFTGYFEGLNGPRHSYREPSMLGFPGSWLSFRNAVYDAGGDGFHTIADAGAGELYRQTPAPQGGLNEVGYDVATHPWGFQWCARFNGGGGFDTAFAFVPVNGAWPPEIDFIEHGPRNGNSVTIHIHWKSTRYNDGNACDPNYPSSNSQNCHANFPQISLVVRRWAAYAVTWSTKEIDVWINGKRIASLTVTPRICTRRADQQDGYVDTGLERLCLPNGYAGNDTTAALEPFIWDMQVNSYDGTTTYPGDQTDLAWFESLRPTS